MSAVSLSKFLAIGLAVLVGLSGCTLQSTEQSHALQGETKFLLPWLVDGKYRWSDISLFTLQNVAGLRGSAAQFLVTPAINKLTGKMMGFRPRVKTFRNSSGTFIATDANSLQLMTLYAHLEKLADFDRSLGLDGLLSYPRTVGVSVVPTSDQKTNNAFYSGEYDALMFLPYEGEDLPLSVNSGVIAHEHFHAIFQKLVAEPSANRFSRMESLHVDHDVMQKHFPGLGLASTDESTPAESETPIDPKAKAKQFWQVYHTVLQRGLNEGLADIWGWIYSGDEIFVGRSVKDRLNERVLTSGEKTNLDLEDARLFGGYMTPFYEKPSVLANKQALDEISYYLGTKYARILRKAFGAEMERSGVSRQSFAPTIINLIRHLAEMMKSQSEDSRMHPAALLAAYIQQLDPKQKAMCEEILGYVPREALTQGITYCQGGTP